MHSFARLHNDRQGGIALRGDRPDLLRAPHVGLRAPPTTASLLCGSPEPTFAVAM